MRLMLCLWLMIGFRCAFRGLIGKPLGVPTSVVMHTSQRLRTNGKPFGTGLLGSRCHDRASSLACQIRQEREFGSMSFHDDQDVSLMAYDQYMRLVNWTPRLRD